MGLSYYLLKLTNGVYVNHLLLIVDAKKTMEINEDLDPIKCTFDFGQKKKCHLIGWLEIYRHDAKQPRPHHTVFFGTLHDRKRQVTPF